MPTGNNLCACASYSTARDRTSTVTSPLAFLPERHGDLN
ncbi:hypothetical protein AVEN_78950-1, partial [Araneus ventricosus]